MVEGQSKGLDHRWNYAYLDPNFRAESLSTPVVRSMVHKRFFWGIQTTAEYETSKRKRVQKDFASKSPEELLELLSQYPLHTVALPMDLWNPDLWGHLEPGGRYSLTLLDGHHRVRYTPKQLKELPTMIFTVEQAYEAYRKRYKGSVSDFVRQIASEMDEALHSFTKINEAFLPAYANLYQEAGNTWSVGFRSAQMTTPVTSAQRTA